MSGVLPAKSQDLRGKTILIVEDEMLIRDFARGVLKREGCVTFAAGDGIEGSMLFAREFGSIDLLITDLSLPGMRGPELAAYARKMRPELPILFMSGSVQFEAENPVKIFAGSAFLPKPFTIQEFLNTVRMALQLEVASPREAAICQAKDFNAENRI